MRLSSFSSKQCIIKQLLDSVFVISRIIKVSVSVISLSLQLRLITLTSTLIIPDITKTSSNNCLLLMFYHNFAASLLVWCNVLVGKFNGLLYLLPGYTKNFYKKDDEILVFHSHEHPSMPAAPYPCKIF